MKPHLQTLAILEKVARANQEFHRSRMAACLVKGMPEVHQGFNNGKDTGTWLNQEIAKIIAQGSKDIEEEEEEPPKKLTQPQIEFEKLVNTFYELKTSFRYGTQTPELEVRFGTRGINKLTKNDYDNVIQKLKSLGFNTYDPNGLYSLRIQCEFIEQNSGKIMLSPIRTEIEGSKNNDRPRKK